MVHDHDRAIWASEQRPTSGDDTRAISEAGPLRDRRSGWWAGKTDSLKSSLDDEISGESSLVEMLSRTILSRFGATNKATLFLKKPFLNQTDAAAAFRLCPKNSFTAD